MLNLKQMVFLLFCGVSNIVSLDSNVWPCQTVTPVEELDLTLVLGKWHLLESMSIIEGLRDSACPGIQLSRNGTHNLIKTGFHTPPVGQVQYENFTVLLNTSSVWDESDIGATTVVLGVINGHNTSTLLLSTCVRAIELWWTGIFGRNLSFDDHQRQLVYSQLQAAGIQNVSSFVHQNTSTCVS